MVGSGNPLSRQLLSVVYPPFFSPSVTHQEVNQVLSSAIAPRMTCYTFINLDGRETIIPNWFRQLGCTEGTVGSMSFTLTSVFLVLPPSLWGQCRIDAMCIGLFHSQGTLSLWKLIILPGSCLQIYPIFTREENISNYPEYKQICLANKRNTFLTWNVSGERRDPQRGEMSLEEVTI